MEPRSFSPLDHFEGRQNEKNERMKRVTALKTTEALTWENILRWKEVEFLQQHQVRLCADVRCLASADTPHQPCELFTPRPRCSRRGGRSVSSVSDWADLYWVHVTHVKNSRHFTALRYTRPHPQTGCSDLQLTPRRKNKTREKRHRNTPASAPVSFLPWPGSSRRYAGQKLLTNTATDVGWTLQVPPPCSPLIGCCSHTKRRLWFNQPGSQRLWGVFGEQFHVLMGFPATLSGVRSLMTETVTHIILSRRRRVSVPSLSGTPSERNNCVFPLCLHLRFVFSSPFPCSTMAEPSKCNYLKSKNGNAAHQGNTSLSGDRTEISWWNMIWRNKFPTL